MCPTRELLLCKACKPLQPTILFDDDPDHHQKSPWSFDVFVHGLLPLLLYRQHREVGQGEMGVGWDQAGAGLDQAGAGQDQAGAGLDQAGAGLDQAGRTCKAGPRADELHANYK